MAAEPLLLFVFASLAVAATPGPSWAFVIATVSRDGLRTGLVGIAGNSLGIICHAAIASAGLIVVFSEFSAGFTILRGLGAGYLVYLGFRFLKAPAMAPAEVPSALSGAATAFRSGLLVNLLNPKVPALMLAMLPQTANRATEFPAAVMFATGVLHAGIAACVLSLLAILVTRSQRLGATAQTRRFLQRICGPIMIAAGLLMLFAL